MMALNLHACLNYCIFVFYSSIEEVGWWWTVLFLGNDIIPD